jgi:hypothetical protein
VENRLSEHVERTHDVPSIFDDPDILPRMVRVHLIAQNLRDLDHPPLIKIAPFNPAYGNDQVPGVSPWKHQT